MAFEIGSEIKDDVLYVFPKGQVNRDSILQLGAEIRRLFDDHELSLALIDCEGMSGMLTVLDMYSTTPRFLELVGLSCRIAYVNPPEEWAVEDDKFSRNVAYNRGGSLEVFELTSDALAWLRS